MPKPTGGLSPFLLRSLYISAFWMLASLSTTAQSDSTLSKPAKQQIVSKPDSSADIWDVYYGFINKKGHRSAESEKPGFHPSFFPELAYALQTGFAVGLNANLSFTSADPQQNVSVIYSTPQYTQYQQVIIPIEANLWTKDNRYNILTDWRYYNYSADNFGLGDESRSDVDDHLEYSYLRLYQSVLRQVAPNFSVGIGYALDYHWRIREENSTPQLNNDFQQYGNTGRSVSSGPTFTLQYTNRRNPNNPQNGFFGSIMFRPNLRLLGSDQNWQSVLADFRKYIPLTADSRHILALWNVNWLSLGGQAPYLDLPSTGWDTHANLGRGYTQGRFRGQNLVYFETEYRAVILNNGLLGGVVFANMQSYSDYPNTAHFGKLLPGWGVGLRIKVNKHSNLNFAFDYGFGIGGSQGVFLNLGEVF
ncbi:MULTISPECIES: BamA/TamA family outer membrane protein [unclassified Spirosoma]|uniref:BamA/TamA family outer membrane protein n=1 Tax=unclassified Spirosoma TaxID=2621999 RepID=UPI0025EDC7D0|nr:MULTISPECIES: BamA/TamA family outer membrane protein [unclassified Spirosoma]